VPGSFVTFAMSRLYELSGLAQTPIDSLTDVYA